MKLILCQPAIVRFEWELEVCLTNLKKVGFDLGDVVLLFTRHDPTIPDYLAEKYGVEVNEYADTRGDKSYIPSVKPWLWWQYLAEDSSREAETTSTSTVTSSFAANLTCESSKLSLTAGCVAILTTTSISTTFAVGTMGRRFCAVWQA